MAHSKPMIAITIMISTSVKPLEPLLVRVVFILFARREPPQADYFIITICSQDCLLETLAFPIAQPMPLFNFQYSSPKNKKTPKPKLRGWNQTTNLTVARGTA